MASKDGVSGAEEFVYRISTIKEWEELQKTGSLYGGELDKSSGFIHLSKRHQVQSTLQNFFLNTKEELYLLQIDAKMLDDGLVHEVVDGSNSFPHFYGPSRSFSPLPSHAVMKAEKLSLSGGQFRCSLLDRRSSPISLFSLRPSLSPSVSLLRDLFFFRWTPHSDALRPRFLSLTPAAPSPRRPEPSPLTTSHEAAATVTSGGCHTLSSHVASLRRTLFAAPPRPRNPADHTPSWIFLSR